jgi:hypothetical protein
MVELRRRIGGSVKIDSMSIGPSEASGTDGSDVSESAPAIEPLTEEKPGRMSSARGNRSDEAGRHADHVTPQILIVNQKYYVTNTSRTEGATVGRN